MAGQGLWPLRAAATIAATLLLSCAPASALPNSEVAMARRQEVVDPAPSVWVSVGPDGAAHTVEPVVTDKGGSTTTISAPPSGLTSTATYTLSPSGHASTFTGAPPVATAKNNGGEGVFLACQVYQGEHAPFCQPKEGSLLSPGKSYYVTWSSQYFANSSTTVRMGVSYDDGDHDGFLGEPVPASQGYYLWTIDPTFLTKQGHSSFPASLYLAYSDTGEENLEDRVDGPSVVVTETESSSGEHHNGGGGGVSAAAVAVPVVIVGVLLLMAGLCYLSWRRHGTLPLIGSLGGSRRRRASSGQGYGIRQSRSQRVGEGDGVSSDKNAAAGGGIQLTDRDSWSPTSGGRNVFREEMQRQQDQGR